MPKLFLPHATLEEWALADKADIQDGKLLLKEEKAQIPVAAAIHFVKLVTGTDDKKLISKVKTQEQTNQLGVEALGDSAILGDTAYEIVPGYVADVAAPKAAPEKKKGNADSDMLAEFLLNKL